MYTPISPFCAADSDFFLSNFLLFIPHANAVMSISLATPGFRVLCCKHSVSARSVATACFFFLVWLAVALNVFVFLSDFLRHLNITFRALFFKRLLVNCTATIYKTGR